jgi:hypothetical protein
MAVYIIRYAESHSKSLSMLRVGQPGFWFPREAGIFSKIQGFRVMSTGSYRRVTSLTADGEVEGSAVFRNVQLFTSPSDICFPGSYTV